MARNVVSGMGNRNGPRWWRSGVPILLLASCTPRERDLAYDPSLDAGESQTTLAGYPIDLLAKIVDQRPIGGAAVGGMTTGGGTLASAISQGSVRVVASPSDLVDALVGDDPRVVLVEPGDYDLAGPSTQVNVCGMTCSSGAPLGTELVLASFCASGAALVPRVDTSGRLAVGANKTIIGLGAGATLHHTEVNVSGSHNVILRNLGIADVDPGVAETSVAIQLYPSQFVWVDHCQIAGGSHSLINIASDFNANAALYPLTDQASNITLSFNELDGRNSDSCAGAANWDVGTLRSPALTVHHNWIHGSITASDLFGPETWGHLFNNLVESTQGYSVSAACGASGFLESNYFRTSASVLHIGDEGASQWPFCSSGLFGQVFAPLGDPALAGFNQVDSSATVNLGGHTVDGTGLAVPSGASLMRAISVPLVTGAETYAYSLDSPTQTWASLLPSQVGLGKLF
jgi:pectate lyase